MKTKCQFSPVQSQTLYAFHRIAFMLSDLCFLHVFCCLTQVTILSYTWTVQASMDLGQSSEV